MSTSASAARANALKEALSYSSSLNHDADPMFQAFISRLLGLSLAVDPVQRRVKVSQTRRQRADVWETRHWLHTRCSPSTNPSRALRSGAAGRPRQRAASLGADGGYPSADRCPPASECILLSSMHSLLYPSKTTANCSWEWTHLSNKHRQHATGTTDPLGITERLGAQR